MFKISIASIFLILFGFLQISQAVEEKLNDASQQNKQVLKLAQKQCEQKMLVTLYKNAEQLIGYYSVSLPIGDSGVSFYDKDGKFVALFAIFGSEEVNKKSAPLIKNINDEYPVSEIICGK